MHTIFAHVSKTISKIPQQVLVVFFSTFRKGLFLTPCIHSMIVQFKDQKTTCDCYKSVFGKYECLDVLLLLGVFIAYKLHFTHVGQVIDRTLIV